MSEKPKSKENLPSHEVRYLSEKLELRAAANEGDRNKIFGYAAVFDRTSENLGSEDYQFFEVLKPGAFDDVLKDDVRALLNHESSAILARSKNGEGSLAIGVDETGLWYEFDAPDTQIGRDLVTSLQRGDIDQSSFSFQVSKDGQEWNEKREGDGPTIITRTINKVKRLFDVSPVTYPAYPDATVALRSLESFREESKDETPKDESENQSSKEDISIAHRQRALDLVDKTAI